MENMENMENMEIQYVQIHSVFIQYISVVLFELASMWHNPRAVASATGGHAGRTAAGSLDELSPFGLRDWIWLDETPWDSLYCNIMYIICNLYINYIY